MAYSFLQDLKDIKELYSYGSKHYSALPNQASEELKNNQALLSIVVETVNQKSATFNFLTRKMVPIMLCSAWDSFQKNLSQDPQESHRHITHFIDPYYKWHNQDIHEISLLRNCIVHNHGEIDQKYLDKSTILKFKILGEVVDFSELEISLQFRVFEDAYNKIMG
ncbi:MAG: hypothetical protein V4473_01650 [Patescibacteria group bacterium]